MNDRSKYQERSPRGSVTDRHLSAALQLAYINCDKHFKSLMMACRGVYKASGATFFRNARIDGSVSAMMDAYGLVKQEIIKDVPNLAPGFAIAVGMELYFRAYPNWRDSEATWDSIYLEDVHRKYGVEVLNAKVSEMLSRLRE